MKTHFSFIIGILFGVTLSLGLCSVSRANPPQKGVVTTGLVRGLGIGVPQSLENRVGLPEKPVSVTRIHQASTIPVTAGGESRVVQTSAEMPIEVGSGAENQFQSLASDEAETPAASPLKELPQQMLLDPNEPEIVLPVEEVQPNGSESAPKTVTFPAVPASAVPASGQETHFSVDSQTNADEQTLENLEALDSRNEKSSAGIASESGLNRNSREMSPSLTSVPQDSPMILASTSPATAAQIQPASAEEKEVQPIPEISNPVVNDSFPVTQAVPETPAISEVPAIPDAPVVSEARIPGDVQSPAPMGLKRAESVSEPDSAQSLEEVEPTVSPLLKSSQGENPAVGIQGSGKPGDAVLEGVQMTRLSLQKEAPQEVQVGQPSTWTISVRNESKITVAGVEIHDSIPEGTKLVNTYPVAQVSRTGEITWQVGNMPAGTMASVKMELLPLREGEIGSVAHVTSQTEASAKSTATRPLLKVETFGDAAVLLGKETELNIVVSNPGTGTTRNIVLSETVPAELQFEGGAELRYEVGDLAPGTSKTVKLPLKAVRPGKFQNHLIAKASANLVMESTLAMEVTAPALKLELQGPSKRFLDKEGVFRLCLTNTGTASAQNIELKATIPDGWKFLRANNLGAFLPEQREVAWKLEELAAGTKAETELVLLPNEIGNFALVYSASADSCQAVNGAKNLIVEGIAALMFQVVDSNDPIQIGEETKYTVEVVNQGSKQAEEVQIVMTIPPGLQVISSEESLHSVSSEDGRQVAFEPIPTLGPKASKVYRFTLRGVTSGDQRVAVKLSSKEFPTPIVKEESTRVFAE